MKRRSNHIDTRRMPAGGYVFAPGVIEKPARRRWLSARRVEQLALVLLVLAYLVALAGLLVVASGRLTLGVLL